MTHGSLFSGIGGFDLAAEWMGWENVFHCENNEFCQKVLKYHFPNSIGYGDIKTTDFSIHRGRIDILTGGFPCQPYSIAGKRKGKEDDRHLWPEMLRAIREIQPGWVVGENVSGITNWNGGMVFNEVQADLEAEGYEVFPYVLPACAINAPHRRDRVWFIAYNKHYRNRRGEQQQKSKQKTNRAFENTNQNGWGSNEWKEKSGVGKFGTGNNEQLWTNTFNALQNVPNTNCDGCDQCNGNNEKHTSKGREYALGNIKQIGSNATNTDNQGLQRSKEQGGIKEIGENGNEQFTRRVQSDFQNFPTEPPICGGDDGLPTELDGITFSKWRNESIKAYGNAIVPQVAYQIFKAIEQYQQKATHLSITFNSCHFNDKNIVE